MTTDASVGPFGVMRDGPLDPFGVQLSERCVCKVERVKSSAAVLIFLLLSAPALAQEGGDSCLTADPPPPGEVTPLRFGITHAPGRHRRHRPGGAGAGGSGEGRSRRLKALRPKRRAARPSPEPALLVGGNEPGSGSSGRSSGATRWAGFSSEIQVRYHPPEGAEGDIEGFEQFVRTAVRRLGTARRRDRVLDHERGEPPGLAQHLGRRVRGRCGRARTRRDRRAAELKRLRRPRLDVGFNVMWRWDPDTRPAVLGGHRRASGRGRVQEGGRQRRRAGLPGAVWPPAPIPGRTAGDEIAEALTLVRHCYMPKAKLGRRVSSGLARTATPTNLGRSEESQAADLESTMEAVALWSGVARDHRLPLVQPARQQLRRHGLLLRGRAPPRRLHAQARVRRLPAGDPRLWPLVWTR